MTGSEVSDGTMPCPVPSPDTGNPCTKGIPPGWTADEGHGGGHFWQDPVITKALVAGAHYDAARALTGLSTKWHMAADCTPDCWKWGLR